MQADSLLGRMHETLTVTKNRYDGDAERVEKTHKPREAFGMFARAIRDDRQLVIITVDFRDQQQISDATRGCVNVHERRRDGYQYRCRVPRDLAQLVMADAGRRIHDHVDCIVGHAQLPATSSLHGFFIGRYAMNGG